MKILLTNDDGIHGEGLRRLAEWSVKLGEVTVAAPKYEQSGRSHGIVIHNAYEIKKSDAFADLGITSYSVDASPADCIRYVADVIGTDFDVVFSGINNGYNLGYDIAYSGTCGAAFEANYAGMRSVSFSTERGNVDRAAEYLDMLWDMVTKNDMLSHANMLNINIPDQDVKGVSVTRQGKAFYRDHFVCTGVDTYEARVYRKRDISAGADLSYDTDAVLCGYCSISPLRYDRTDNEARKKLKI